jgi:hypothetical protein
MLDVLAKPKSPDSPSLHRSLVLQVLQLIVHKYGNMLPQVTAIAAKVREKEEREAEAERQRDKARVVEKKAAEELDAAHHANALVVSCREREKEREKEREVAMSYAFCPHWLII